MLGAVERSRSVAVRVRMRKTQISVIWRRIRRWKNSYSDRRIMRFKNYLNGLYTEAYCCEINKQERYCRFYILMIIRRRVCHFSDVNRVTSALRFVKNGPFRAYSEEVNVETKRGVLITRLKAEECQICQERYLSLFAAFASSTLSRASLTFNMQTYILLNCLENHNF